MSEDYVYALFIPFGPIAEVKVQNGTAHVEFEDEDDALAAVDNMDGAQVYGKIIKVTKNNG